MQEKASGLPAKAPLLWSGKATRPSSEPMAPVPVPTTSGKKIALEVPSTLTPLEDSTSLHLIPLGSLQGAVSAFTCCGSPLAVVGRQDSEEEVSLQTLHLLLCVWQVFCHHRSISEERFGDPQQVCASHVN